MLSKADQEAQRKKREEKNNWYRNLWDWCVSIDQTAHGEKEAAVREALADLGVSRANFYIYLNRYREDPKFQNLSPRLKGQTRQGMKRKPRIAEDRYAHLRTFIDKHYLKRDKKSATKVYELYEIDCLNCGLKPISPSQMWRTIKAIPESEISRKRDPEELRNKKYRLNHEVPDLAFAPLEIVQIDHRRLDIEAVDSVTRMPCGRPWFTGIVDHYSSALLGFYLTLDAPSSVSVARALLHCATPKQAWMEKNGIPGIWEMHGVPSVVYSDNGSDFASEAIRDGYRRQGINPPMFRPGGQPHYGALIERTLQTLGLVFVGDGGDTGKSPGDRGERKPEKSACMTLEEMEFRLASHIANDFHVLRKSKNASPRLLWKKALEKGLFEQTNLSGEALRNLYIDFLPTFSATITQQGVRKKNMYFSDPILNKWMGMGKFNQEFHFDPKDARFIYFKDPEDDLYYEIPSVMHNLEPISFADYNVWLKEIWAESDDLVDYGSVIRSREWSQQVLEKAEQLTQSKKAIAAAEKRRRTKRPDVVDEHTPRRGQPKAAPNSADADDEEIGEITLYTMKEMDVGR